MVYSLKTGIKLKPGKEISEFGQSGRFKDHSIYNGLHLIIAEMQWPWAVLFILPIELGERFSFLGTRVLLNQYLKAGFGLEDEEARLTCICSMG
ncbi:hypothetical protein DSO57_1020745 [Entomophthora muscae]|uniref:Uncharacterized protein n=1 Tax=Entomophthora muscae TaxID=34485 RepID=A0ACC2RID6_9FUNG|nr:hypothetical protein DSO57_1020745 [Entomophthora muscae]